MSTAASGIGTSAAPGAGTSATAAAPAPSGAPPSGTATAVATSAPSPSVRRRVDFAAVDRGTSLALKLALVVALAVITFALLFSRGCKFISADHIDATNFEVGLGWADREASTDKPAGKLPGTTPSKTKPVSGSEPKGRETTEESAPTTAPERARGEEKSPEPSSSDVAGNYVPLIDWVGSKIEPHHVDCYRDGSPHRENQETCTVKVFLDLYRWDEFVIHPKWRLASAAHEVARPEPGLCELPADCIDIVRSVPQHIIRLRSPSPSIREVILTLERR